MSHETDEECRILLGHALAEVRQRFTASLAPTESAPSTVGAAAFPACFTAAEPAVRLTLIRQLPPTDLPVLAEFAVRVFQRETHPLVARDLIRRFHPVWPEGSRQVLGRALASEWQTVRFAALEALIAIAPRELLSYLPGLLRHADPRVRSMAIRALASIDAPEAARHLEAQLLGPETDGRWSALRECARLPFVLTRPVLMAYLDTESDVELLDAAGAIIVANPDVETPFVLAGLLSRRPEIGKWLAPLLQTSIGILHDSGQLSEDLESYKKRLQLHVDQLAARRIVHRAVSGLATGDPALQAEAKTTLRQYLDRPEVRRLLEEMLETPPPGVVSQFVKEILHPEDTPIRDSVPDRWPAEGSDAEQLRWLSTRQAESWHYWKPTVEKLLSDTAVGAALKIGALRVLARCRVIEAGSLAIPLLKHADDGVAAAALEYLAIAAPDEVIPVIGKHLKASRPKVRLAAIRVLRSTDPLQAVSLLFQLVETCTVEDRELTMQCLIQFEFSLIRDRLLELMESGKAPEIFDDALALFDANPDTGSLYPLFRLARRLGGEKAARIDQLRSRVADLLIKTRQLRPEVLKTLEAEFPNRLQLDDVRRAEPRPAYALRELERESESVWTVARNLLRQVFQLYNRQLLIALVVGLTLHWAFGCRQTPVEVKARSGAVIQNEVSRGAGILLQVTELGWKMRLNDGVIWHLSPPTGGFPFIIEGMKVIVEAALFRRGADGSFQGRCLAFKITL